MQAKPKFAQLLIPTVDSVRYEYLLTLVLSVQKARPHPRRPCMTDSASASACTLAAPAAEAPRVRQATLLVGGPGTAKTSTINQFLGRCPPEEMGAKTVTFSSLTTPAIFQQAIEARPWLAGRPAETPVACAACGHCRRPSLAADAPSGMRSLQIPERDGSPAAGSCGR